MLFKNKVHRQEDFGTWFKGQVTPLMVEAVEAYNSSIIDVMDYFNNCEPKYVIASLLDMLEDFAEHPETQEVIVSGFLSSKWGSYADM